MLTLKLEDKTIELNTHEVDGKTLYKAQDLLKGYGDTPKQYAKRLENWSNSVNYPKTGVVNKEGRYGGTYLTKRNLLKLAARVSVEFEDAVYEAFEALLGSRNEAAMAAAGSVAIDYDLVAEVESLWKDYREWVYSTFSEVNQQYGGNLTRLAISYSLGVAKVSDIKGSTDANAVQKLVSQEHGAAIMALGATIKTVNSIVKSGFVDDKLETREGKKEAYKAVKAFLEMQIK